jgi:hypothetical protein
VDEFTEKQMADALIAINDMMSRAGKAKEKFVQGTSQHTLQKNRLNALHISFSLISKELAKSDAVTCFAEDDLKNAIAQVTSLIRKSEKALGKLAQGTWQHTMLSQNLKALYIALPLIKKALNNNDCKK